MTVTAITSYNFSLFLHVTAVMVGFGSTFALAIATPVALKLDPRHLPYVHELSIALNKYFASPALVIVLATGFYQVSEGNWKLGDAWISATLAIVIALGAIMGAVFMPGAKKLKALAERDIAAAGDGQIQLSDEYNKRARTDAIYGPITGLLLVAAVFLMVTKPGV
ncbi:MAG: hypothetical protein QOH76_2375 [Thermoleophilaceae bacterium]|jgi:uncharacterized membrane protein|nr:hypothetical protein [Thermoleophilaceae bacterium]